MNPIAEMEKRLTKYPQVQYTSDATSITVLPATDEGFSLTLTVNSKDSYTVCFEGWHEESADAEEALNLFALGLSTDCRLKEYRRGNFAYKWTMEFKEETGWSEQGTVGLLIFPFWKKPRMRILQNRLLA